MRKKKRVEKQDVEDFLSPSAIYIHVKSCAKDRWTRGGRPSFKVPQKTYLSTALESILVLYISDTIFYKDILVK